MMIKAKALSSFLGVSLLLLVAGVFAQQPVTVGELLDKGSVKLTKEEITTLLTGATVSGIQQGRPQTKLQITTKG